MNNLRSDLRCKHKIFPKLKHIYPGRLALELVRNQGIHIQTLNYCTYSLLLLIEINIYLNEVDSDIKISYTVGFSSGPIAIFTLYQ